MEIFRNKTMSLNSGYVAYQLPVRAMWRLAISKAGMAGRIVSRLLQTEQVQPSKNIIVDIKIKKQIHQLEYIAELSPAQRVFAVIYKQQIEWMNDAKKGK